MYYPESFHRQIWIFDPKVSQSYMLNRYENDISQVWPIYNIPYYLTEQTQNLVISEMDDRDKRQNYQLFQGREIKNLQVDSVGKNIYFLDKLKDGYNLFKIEIQ